MGKKHFLKLILDPCGQSKVVRVITDLIFNFWLSMLVLLQGSGSSGVCAFGICSH